MVTIWRPGGSGMWLKCRMPEPLTWYIPGQIVSAAPPSFQLINGRPSVAERWQGSTAERNTTDMRWRLRERFTTQLRLIGAGASVRSQQDASRMRAV